MIDGAITRTGAKGLGGELPGHVHYGTQGPMGPYYTPAVTQLDEDTVQFEFTPSKPDMPAVNPVTVELPAGQGSGENADQGSGLSGTAKTLLITILRNGIYSTDQSANINLLETALSSGGSTGGGGSEEVEQYSVTNNLTNVSNSNTAVTVVENSMYIATLTAVEGYAIDSVTVTMGGVDVTASVYSGGAVTIATVTGDIVITASAVEDVPENAYIQDGLLHEFTDLTTARTIAGGMSIFNSENDFTVFGSSAQLSVNFIGEPGSGTTAFAFYVNWNGTINAKLNLTDNSAWPSIQRWPTDSSAGIMKHACMVKRGNDYFMYIYGLEGTGSMGSGGKHYILDGDSVVNNTNKVIDKMLIYNRALSEEEISATFNTIKQEVGE